MKIYISKYNGISIDELQGLVQLLENNGNEIKQFIKPPYDENILLSCEYVIALIPEPSNELLLVGRGQYSEIALSLSKGIKTLIYDNDAFYLVSAIKIYNKNDWKKEYGDVITDDYNVKPEFIK